MIDTIFYFATTMDEYRNLVEEQQISARTIVFVEETLEIYKNGKLYPDISGVKKAINNASTKSWLDTVRAIGELNNELREAFNASIKDTNDSLAEAQIKINEIRTKLGNLTDSEGNALIDIDKANGLIELFAEYWNVDNQTYTNFENIWNAQAGKAGLTAEFVNTVNSTLTTYQNIVDIVNTNKDEWIKFSDVANASETEISEEWNAAKANAIRKLKKVDTIDQKLTTIYEKWQIQEDGTSVWDTLNAQVTENTTALSGILTLVNTDGALASLIAAYTDGNLTFLSDLKTHADGNESYFDLTAAKITGVLENDNNAKATIFGWVKDQLSGLRLSANLIYIGENLTLKDDLTEIRGLLHVADTVIVGTAPNPQILIDSTNGIKHTGGKFQINMDGSGFFGNENSKISWTPDGAITATGINITSSNYVPKGWDELKGDVANLKSNAVLKGNSIKFIGDTDTVELSLDNGLKHYKTNLNPEVSGYNLKNDGSGYIANKNITWNTDGSGNIGGNNGISWNTDGTIILGSAVEGKSEGATYAYLTSTGILFNNTNDKVELKSPAGTNGGLIHTYKNENGQDTNNHGYALYNDGSGLVANNVIHWNNEGELTIGYKSNDPEGPDNSLTWDKDGNLIIGANFIVQGTDYSLEFSDIDKALSDLDLYNKSRAYITDAGIIIDNQNTLNRVTLATTDVGLIHLEIESYIEGEKTKYRVKENGRSAYGFYNDGHGYVANGIIAWNVDGSGSIGTGDKKITWTPNGELVLGSGLIVGGGTTVVENPYDDTELENAIKALKLYNTDRAYLKNTGILFENKTDGNLVGLTSVDPKDETSVGGLIHTYIDASGNTTTNPPTHGYALYNDGTGELANGHIKWGLKTVTEEQNGQQVQVEKAWLSIDADDLNIYSGKDGQDGKQGADGQDGKDGENITEYIDRTVTNNITKEGSVVKEYINTTITTDMSGYLKTTDLKTEFNKLGLIKDWAMKEALDALAGRVDGIDSWKDNLDLGDGVTETQIHLWISDDVNTYMNGRDFLTGSDLEGLVSIDELTTALKFYVVDNNGNVLCTDLNGQVYAGQFGEEEVTENDTTVIKKYFISNGTKYYWDAQERAYISGDIKLTPVTVTAGDMTAGILKLNTYFIAAVDQNGKLYKGQFFVETVNNEEKEYFQDEDGNKYYLITDESNANYGKYYAKIGNTDYYLTKKLGMASSVDVKSQVNNYINNETALSRLTTWANEILGLKNGGKAGFTLEALLLKITGADLNSNNNDAVTIKGLVDAYNSSLELNASQVKTDGYGETSATGTLAAKLYSIDLSLGEKLTAESTVFTNVKNTVDAINEDYLKSDDVSNNKIKEYLTNIGLTDNTGKLVDLEDYVLLEDYTEAIAGLKSRIGNAESSIVSKTTLNKILRRHQLLDKQLNETITNSEQVELTQIEADLARLAELLDDSTILNDIESRKILLEKSELTSDEQSALDVYNNYLSEYDTLVETYGDDPELYNTYLESVIYNYISTSNKIQSKIDDKVASIETLVTKETKRVNGEDITALLSGVKISADDIYLNGTTWALVINADSIVSKQLHSYSGQVSNPTSTSDGYHVDISNGVIEGYNYSNNTKSEIYKFNADGSGYIGNNFSWTIDGVVTLSGVNAASVQTSSNGFHVDVMNGYIKGYTTGNENTPTYVFNNDGSGDLAFGNIHWNSDGSGYFGSLIADPNNLAQGEPAGGRPFEWDEDGELAIGGWIVDNVSIIAEITTNDTHKRAELTTTIPGLMLTKIYNNHTYKAIFGTEGLLFETDNATTNYFNIDGTGKIGGWTINSVGELASYNNLIVLHPGITSGDPVINIGGGGGAPMLSLSNTNGLITHSSGTTTNLIKQDGSGFLAKDNISWTTDGDINFGNLITINHIGAANHDIELSEDAIIIWNLPGDLTANTMSQLLFEINGDSYNSYTGTLNIGEQTLLFINGILVQQ